MASFLRVARQGCRILASTSQRAPLIRQSCAISTSKKNKDAISVNENVAAGADKKQESLLDKEENWISFGYDLTDRDYDEWSHKAVLFTVITLVFGLGGLYIAYLPDFKMRDWAMREGYLELDRRTKAGEPLVSPDLIPAD